VAVAALAHALRLHTVAKLALARNLRGKVAETGSPRIGVIKAIQGAAWVFAWRASHGIVTRMDFWLDGFARGLHGGTGPHPRLESGGERRDATAGSFWPEV